MPSMKSFSRGGASGVSRQRRRDVASPAEQAIAAPRPWTVENMAPLFVVSPVSAVNYAIRRGR